MKRILHLTLHKKWFDQIASGIKTKEYREKKPYWIKRLVDKEYDEVWFRTGYSKIAPFMRVEYLGLDKSGKEFAIQLGKIIEIRNYNSKKL